MPFLLLGLALTGTAFGQPGKDSGEGTWTLNIAKSTYKPGPAPRSETRTYQTSADGMHHLTVHEIAADGTAIDETTAYKFDGKPYDFTGSSQIDAVEVTRVNANEIRVTQFRQGKVIGHFTRVVSKDGRTMTATNTLRTAAGKTEHDVRVYDRQ